MRKAALLSGGPTSLGRLQTLHDEIEVKPLRYCKSRRAQHVHLLNFCTARTDTASIPQAASNTYDATRVESMARYFDVGPMGPPSSSIQCALTPSSHAFQDVDSTPLSVSRKKFLIALNYADVVRRGRVFTINRGDSNLA